MNNKTVHKFSYDKTLACHTGHTTTGESLPCLVKHFRDIAISPCTLSKLLFGSPPFLQQKQDGRSFSCSGVYYMVTTATVVT